MKQFEGIIVTDVDIVFEGDPDFTIQKYLEEWTGKGCTLVKYIDYGPGGGNPNFTWWFPNLELFLEHTNFVCGSDHMAKDDHTYTLVEELEAMLLAIQENNKPTKKKR
jgi:hypothetical protein